MTRRRSWPWTALVLCLTLPARAADRAVHLASPPPVRPGIAAMPLIADPADAAERRINAALRQLDTTVRRAAAACRTYTGRPGTWQRRVEAAMRGPGFLSLVIQDESFCDGAHPASDLMSIVYDLRTGRPVDWTTLLPPGLTGRVALVQGGDGTRMVTLASTRLWSLYRAGYGAGGVPPEERQACREAVAAQGDMAGDGAAPGLMAWLDAAGGGLAVQVQLPHVVQACAEAVVIPAATLAREGADAGLLASIAAARR